MSSLASPLSPPFTSSSFRLRLGPSGVEGFSRFLFNKFRCNGRRSVLLVPVRCLSTGPGDDGDSEIEASSSSSSRDLNLNWFAVLGGIGFVETMYLWFLKLTNSDAFCPTGGGTCGDILNCDYGEVFGFPLPLIGMAAYGLVTTIGLLLPGKNLPFGVGEYNGRLVLLGVTTSMAAASAYLLYVLSSKFAGASWSYCLLSAFLSFSLFFITLKGFGFQEIQKLFGFQPCVALLVIFTLNNSYSLPSSASLSLAEVDLRYFTADVTKPSSPLAISLAKHLHSIGAKMYGAFWCSHCLEQKELFGNEAVKLLDYVECFPDGYQTGTKMDKACIDARIEGFPTWIINGQVVSGEKELSELAEPASGFKSDEIKEPV